MFLRGCTNLWRMTVLQYGLSLTTGAFTGPMRAAQGSIKGFTSELSNIGNTITGLANIPGAIRTLVEPLTKPITLAADVEVLEKSFKTLLGSGKQAAQMLKDVTQFSGSTPFQITEVAPAAKQLLAFGFAAGEVIPLMKDNGDMAALMDKPINEVADGFGRMKSGQFGEAFERMRAFGISMKDLEGVGLVFDRSGSFVGSADQAMEGVRKIIRRKFGGGMKEISGTFKGQFSNLTDSWEQMETKFGAPITRALTPIISELTARIAEWQPKAEAFGKTLATGISGAFNLFKSGELGAVVKSAFIGANKAVFGNLGTILSGAMRIGAEVLKGVFQSAVNLFTDGGFWQSVKYQFLSIAESFRSVMLSTMADVVDLLPAQFRLGADTKEMRKQAGESDKASKAYSYSAEYVAGKIDFEQITAPMLSSANEAGAILKETITQIGENLGNIPEFKNIGESLRNAAAGQNTAPMVPLAEQLRQASSGDMFLSGAAKREFRATETGGYGQMVQVLNPQVMENILNPKKGEGGTGLAGMGGLWEGVQKLLGGAGTRAESFLNPKGSGPGDGPKAADLKKSLDESAPIKRLVALLERVEANTANLTPAGVYAN